MRFAKSENDLVCVSAVRTPFGRFGGALKDIDIYDLGATAMKNAMERIRMDPAMIDEVWWGNGDTTNAKDPYTPVIARQSLLKAGMPPETPSVTFDQACTSAMTAVKYGGRSIRLGEAEIVMTGGATSFSTVPFLLRGIRWEGRRHSSFPVEDPIIPLGYKDFAPVALDSDAVALEYGVSREEQDAFAFASHVNYGRAWNAGFFRKEMAPLQIVRRDKKGGLLSEETLEIDEQYRPQIRMEDLARLNPVFGSKACTAGNSPGMNDGATAQILMKRAKAERLGLEPLYTIVATAAIALQPRVMPVAPAFAIKKCLEEARLAMEDMKWIEINEAFASVPLVSLKLLSNDRFLRSEYAEMVAEASKSPLSDYDERKYGELKNRLNVNGGAVAIGHPNTASGARLMMTAAYHLKETGGGYAACAICGGLTQGAAAILWVDERNE